jgi:ABC-type branched-subunit amino acid transport system ATPase component
VLLVDEPSAGAALEDLELLKTIFTGLKADGLAVLLVEHNLGLVRTVADHVLGLELGRVSSRESNLSL